MSIERYALLFVLILAGGAAGAGRESGDVAGAKVEGEAVVDSKADNQPVPCARVLALSSRAWVDRATARQDGSTPSIETALAHYAKCYEEATDALAARLKASGRSPSAKQSKGMVELESALEAFLQRALHATLTGGTYGRVQASYASLYARQFRREFYVQLEGASAGTATPADGRPTLSAAQVKWKSIVAAQPENGRAGLRESMERLLGAASVLHLRRLAVYEFGISILQSPAEPEFSPPPF